MSIFRVGGSSPSKGSQDRQGLLPISLVAQSRRPYGFRHVVNKIQGRVWTLQGLFAQVAEKSMLRVEGTVGQTTVHVPLSVSSDEEEDTEADKKQLQWRRWSEDVIPNMIAPYMELLFNTTGLRDMKGVRQNKGCDGCALGRFLEVSCIFFECMYIVWVSSYDSLIIDFVLGIEKITLCTCTSPALQLLNRGLFPCVPLEPSLAVDLNVLDFAKELFVNAAPNTTAWCETLEGFLSSRKFKLKTRVRFFLHKFCFVLIEVCNIEQSPWTFWKRSPLVFFPDQQ